jgi:hypothetical protein
MVIIDDLAMAQNPGTTPHKIVAFMDVHLTKNG